MSHIVLIRYIFFILKKNEISGSEPRLPAHAGKLQATTLHNLAGNCTYIFIFHNTYNSDLLFIATLYLDFIC